MTKQPGLANQLWVDGNNVSGDAGAINNCHGGQTGQQNLTGLDQVAMARGALGLTGGLDWTAFFNKASGQAHPVLSALPRSDRYVTWCLGQTLGAAAATLLGVQIGYDPARGQDGSLTIRVTAESDGQSLAWGELHTAGIRTDTAASNGTGVDGGAASTHGVRAWLHVFGFTGTDATVKLQESSDNGVGDAWADVAGGAFAQVTTGHVSKSLATSTSLAVERWLRVVTTTSAGFTSLAFGVAVARDLAVVAL